MSLELVMIIGGLLRAVPVLAVGAVGVFLFSRSTLGKALIHRLQEGDSAAAEIAALQTDLSAVRRELGEVHERLDFAERRLIQRPLPPSRSDMPSPPDPVLTPS